MSCIVIVIVLHHVMMMRISLMCSRYQLEGYAETLVWDIDVMNRHLQKLEIGIEGREAVGESTQQLMDHMDRRIPDMMNWRKRCVISICRNMSNFAESFVFACSVTNMSVTEGC